MSVIKRRGHASKFHAYRLGAQNIPSGANTQVQLNNVLFDTLNEFDEVTTWLFTATQTGYYHFIGQIEFIALPVGTQIGIGFLLNGGVLTTKFKDCTNLLPESMNAQLFTYLVRGGTVGLYTFQNTGINRILNGGVYDTTLDGFRVY